MEKLAYTTKKGVQQWRPVVSESALWEDRSAGFCLACGAEAGEVEPDGRKLRCEGCGAMKVYGLEELVAMGLARITAE